MKTVAIVLIVAVIALGGVMGYALFHTSLTVEGQGIQKYAAADRQEDFAALQDKMERGSLEGVIFQNKELLDAGQYTFYVYTLRLKNTCLVPAEMVEMQLAPQSGDVLFYGETGKIDIDPGAERDIWGVLLTAGTPTSVREITVTYYLWGNARTVKYTFEQQ